MSRQIKDIKDKNTGQLVYPRTHIKAVVINESTSLEDIIDANMGPRLDNVEEQISNKQDSIIKLTNVEASIWVEDSTYEDFPYRCDIIYSDINSNYYAEVIFALDLATSNEYAPICETGEGFIRIWSSANSSIIIPTILITK